MVRGPRPSHRGPVSRPRICEHWPIVDGLDFDRIAWGEYRHLYGPATDVPRLLRGLRQPDEADACLAELTACIAPPGGRDTATAVTVPFLVTAAADPSVPAPVRSSLLLLVEVCAVGALGDHLDWAGQRQRQGFVEEQAAWEAVAAEHPRLDLLLEDPDPGVARAALTVLAWTGGRSPRAGAWIRGALSGAVSPPDQCAAWLAAVVLGRLPDGVSPPVDIAHGSAAVRFGRAVAALRFCCADAPPAAVDEVCAVFADVDVRTELAACEFMTVEGAELFAAAALAFVPPLLRSRATGHLLAAIDRGPRVGVEALEAYLRFHLGPRRNGGVRRDTLPIEAFTALSRLPPALAKWSSNPIRSPWIPALADYGLPSTPDDLAIWIELAHRTSDR